MDTVENKNPSGTDLNNRLYPLVLKASLNHAVKIVLILVLLDCIFFLFQHSISKMNCTEPMA
jgi:hypothetical protein